MMKTASLDFRLATARVAAPPLATIHPSSSNFPMSRLYRLLAASSMLLIQGCQHLPHSHASAPAQEQIAGLTLSSDQEQNLARLDREIKQAEDNLRNFDKFTDHAGWASSYRADRISDIIRAQENKRFAILLLQLRSTNETSVVSDLNAIATDYEMRSRAVDKVEEIESVTANNPSFAVQSARQLALSRIAREAVDTATSHYKTEHPVTPRSMKRALELAMPYIDDLFASTNRDVRIKVIPLYGQAGAPGLIRIKQACKDPDKWVRICALRALSGEPGLQALAEIRSSLDDDSLFYNGGSITGSGTRWNNYGVDALARLPRDAAIAELCRACRHSNVDVRIQALNELYFDFGQTPTEAIPTLLEVLFHDPYRGGRVSSGAKSALIGAGEKVLPIAAAELSKEVASPPADRGYYESLHVIIKTIGTNTAAVSEFRQKAGSKGKCSVCGKCLQPHYPGVVGPTYEFEGVHCKHCKRSWCDNCKPPPSRDDISLFTCPACGNVLSSNIGEWLLRL
jgi:hypothetical protein